MLMIHLYNKGQKILTAASDTGTFSMDTWKKKNYFIYVFNSIKTKFLSTNG